MFFSKKRVIGLDIGTSSIKMAELDVSGSKATLLSYGMMPTPAGSVTAGEISNPSTLSQAIRSLAIEIRSKRKHVCTGMWGTAVIIKKITIPKVEKKFIDQQIRWEAEQYIPFDINEISLAFQVLPTSSVPETMDVILVGAQNALVQQYISAISGAGLQLAVLDVSGFALANAFEFNYGRQNGKSIALVNLGATVTNLTIVSQGEAVFTRDIPIGGLNYTNEIHKELGVSVAEAESLKLSVGKDQAVPEQVNQVIKTVNENIAEEVHNSIEYFAASGGGPVVNAGFYSGGASSTPELVQKVAAASNVPFQPLNPFIRVKPARHLSVAYLSQVAPFATLAVGLGLRHVGDA